MTPRRARKAATPLVSVEEYLRTSYEPDAEYVDGVVEERPVGENQHSAWQMAIGGFFRVRSDEWNIRVRPELRTKTGERRYRIPDVAVLDADAPEDPVALVPPLIAFEVLSPEDRMSKLRVRLADFEVMGVPGIYVVEPESGALMRWIEGGLPAADRIVLRDREIAWTEIKAVLR